MKVEVLFFLITGFLIWNTYHDEKYTNMIKMNKKYIKMAMYGFTAFTIYLFFKKHPYQSKTMLLHANDMIKYLPIDKNAKDIFTPLFNLTKENNMNYPVSFPNERNNSNVDPRLLYSGNNNNNNINNISNHMKNDQRMKRSVSETKKKYVASNQQWKCGHCHNQLDYTFEVDHILDLQYGGSNNIENLVALCRNCHGKKTMASKI